MEVREPAVRYLAKPVFKESEIGLIPTDWSMSTVGDEFVVELGKMLDSEKNIGVPKPFLGNRAVQWGHIDVSDVGEIKLLPSELQRFRLRDGDLLVCEGGEVGRSAIWRQLIEECYYQKALHRLRPKRGFNASLMQNILQLYSITGVLQNYVTQTSIAHLPKDKFETIPIPVPPTTKEQQAIAEALSDADALIESLEQLLAKKLQIKQGTIQELLAGRKRLPGFVDEWEKKQLEHLANIRSGGTPSTSQSEFWEGDVLWCTPTDITALNGYKYLSNTARTITTLGLKASSAEIIPPRSIVMTSRATIGECAINLVPLSTNQGFKNFVPFECVDAEFLYYLLTTQKQGFVSLCGGSTFLEISKTQLASYPVSIPPTKEEQTAIATVLSDIDAEIAMLEARLDKARSTKQGMMQELLTGRIRLVPPKAEVIPFPVQSENSKPAKEKPHNWQINEAVVISVLAKHFGSEQWPLGRKRYTKLSYLLHRHVEHQAKGYLKKAAGPYNPATKYKGPEGIALKNGYIRQHARDQFSGFVAAEKIGEAEDYFIKWYGADALAWLKQFRMEKNDELELLATVDMAMEDLRHAGDPVMLDAVKQIIQSHPEWQAKLDRPIFSDANIECAIVKCHNLFGD